MYEEPPEDGVMEWVMLRGPCLLDARCRVGTLQAFYYSRLPTALCRRLLPTSQMRRLRPHRLPVDLWQMVVQPRAFIVLTLDSRR